jgi:hypothetical protein
MYTQWIEDCVVHGVSLHDGLALDLDDYNEVVISPLRLTLPAIGDFPAEEAPIDPNRVAAHERPLLDVAGEVRTHAWCGDDGALHLGFPAGTASTSTLTRTPPPGSSTANATVTWRACHAAGSGWSATTSPKTTTPMSPHFTSGLGHDSLARPPRQGLRTTVVLVVA